MSYDIYIGNAELLSEWPGEDDEPVAEWTVNSHAEDAAPSFPFDTMTANGNSRHPGYSQWGDFCREAGLYDLFFGVEYGDPPGFGRERPREGGLMRHHPGIAPLTPAILATVTAARQRRQEQHPDAVPGWDFSSWQKPELDDGVRGRDHILARLLWLEWWMDYALRTCERPAIYNR